MICFMSLSQKSFGHHGMKRTPRPEPVTMDF